MKFSTLLLKQSVPSVLKYLRKPVRFIPATFQKAIFLFLFSFILTRSFSQQLTWAHSAGGSSIDISTTVAKDNAGNVYIAGKFSGANVDFDPSPAVFLLSSAGGTDAFVAKYNAAGQFQWAFRFGGNSLDEVHRIALDQNDNFFITGYFRGINIDFDPGPGAANVSSNGDAGTDPGYGGDIFIAKYNSAGVYQWAFNIGGTDLYDAGIGISTDAAGNVYAGGYFTNTADFDPSPGTAILNSAVSGSIFLAKYSNNGAYQWAFGLGSPVTNNALHDIKTDALGNVYITGYYQGTNIDFDPGPGVAPLNANGGYEIFVAKYNTNGQYQLAFSVGGPGWDVARGIGLDNTGNIYIIGDFNNTVDFDPGPGTAFLTSNGQNDAVLAKYSPAGQYLWAFGFGGTPNEYGSKVIIDNAHVFITGSFSGTADLDPSAGVENLTSAGGYDIYLGKYTLDGEYLCSFRVGGPGDDGGHALVSTAPNVFCLTGFFSGTNIDFDPGATALNLSSAGAEDIFLAKYTWPDNVPPTGTLAGDVICSGEQAQLTFTATAGTGPFTITYNNGTTDIVQTNVQSGVPFNITPNPSFTTIYTLVGIRDALRCSETNFVSEIATVTVNNCSPCNNWLNLPSFQSYVRVGDLDVPGNQITVEAVFTRTTPYTGGQVWAGDLVSKHNTPSDVNYLLRPNNAEITTTNGYFRTPDICEIELNKTYHAAMVYDGTTLKFYRNGFLMSSVPATGNLFQNNFQTRIGLYDAIVNNTNLIGYINEVRIWNVVRTEADIRTYMNSSLPAPATQTGLLAYYTFDNLLNKQGNPVWNGTLGGAASINQTNPNCNLLIDSCSLLSPCSQWLSTPSLGSKVLVGDLDITGNQLTIEAIFNRTQLLNNGLYYGNLVSKHTDQTNVNYSLLPNGCEITTDVSGYKATFQNCVLDLNRTYHVAMVYNGSSLKYYRDGFLLSQVPCTGNIINNNLITTIGQVAGGTDPVNNQFLGNINEVRIWNTARTQAEIRTYMGASLPNPATQPGLAANYVFNDLINKQGNVAWNGTLAGAASINQTNPNCDFTADSCSILQEQIINDYTGAISFDVCKNTLTVSDASNFNVGDTVLLIQMKGSVIDSTNTASFGTITDYKNAGNYEFNYIKTKNGNVLELLNVVERQYDLPNGKVQLIRVPYFQDYNVTAPLTCLPWNGSIGGVLAFNVQNTLTLNQDINVSGKGFRGGKGVNTDQTNTFCFANDYSYAFGSILAAEKGESIVELSNNFMLGKGNTAGGGGGGNDHNSGGGGGANGGIGGFGGYQYEPCGSAPFDNRGIGGRVLPYGNAANKIFMGSGGGAGHANNQQNISVPSDGGHGGGIVLISAQTLISNSHKIVSNGADAPVYVPSATQHCHEAMGGGGAGGTILLNISTIQDNTTAELNGGKGANMTANVPLYGRIGPGGGGGGGVLWSSTATMPANLTVSSTGGANGVLTTDSNNPWGTTPGQTGFNLFGLVVPIDDVLFRPNIDSVRIKDSIIGCSSFDFKGFGYINTYPVTSWQWYFGDGNMANTQNTTHTYISSGTFTVKLVVTDINGCKDSIAKDITTIALDIDFSYQLNACSPLTVQFNSIGSSSQNPYWSFGDATTVSGVLNPVHTYPSENTYIVKYSVSNGTCTDTVTKTISLAIIPDDIVLTRDTTICFGATKQLLTKPALSFCWNPTTYLNDPNSANPKTSTPQNITYYYTAEITGNNLVVNGDFSQGNTGFTSQYTYAPMNTTEGQYFVGTNPSAWGGGFQNCGDHTSLNGNMMIVNAVQAVNVNDIVWEETLTVLPNTNYAFSTWILSLQSNNPGQVQFSINGRNIGGLINAVPSSCNWAQFYTTWNSGNNTTAVISIVNKLTFPSGNDFALDDISFAPVFIKRDSVIITVENPIVRTNNDTTICPGIQVQLNATDAVGYSWSPITGLNNSGISNPLASPLTTTQYIVSGTSLNGCLAKDTINIIVYPKPDLITSNDTIICKNSSLQLFASGGVNYGWSPAATLSNPNISNPVASPSVNTTYYVNITDANACNNLDSVKVDIRPDPVFTISPPAPICENDPVQLTAGGGNVYSWQPTSSLSNPAISNPVATPSVNTNYSVVITETNCNATTTLTTTITVLPLPLVRAAKLNDIDCSNDRSQLNATGATNYLWSPAATLSNAGIANPVAAPVSPTKYVVSGTDDAGCINYDSVIVNVENINKGGYLMPNAFTPNGDGLNDCYGIRYWGVIEEVEFSIYNRWGERIFFTKNPNACWDGTYKGTRQDIAVYVYLIKAKTTCESSVFRKGTFALIR